MATICGHKLQNFLLAATSIPSKFSSEVVKLSGTISDAYCTWEQQDQLLLSWLLSSISDSMLTMMVGVEHLFEVWNKLDSFFDAQTKAKVR